MVTEIVRILEENSDLEEVEENKSLPLPAKVQGRFLLY